MGLGLPTRDILDPNHVGKLRTGLRGPYGDGVPDQVWRLRPDSVTDNVTYERLVGTLAATDEDGQYQGGHTDTAGEGFHWLWRSQLRDYDRHSRPWRKWLNHLFLWTHHYQHRFRHHWLGGFKPYDEMQRGEYREAVQFASFLEFAKMCDLLVTELREAHSEDPEDQVRSG